MKVTYDSSKETVELVDTYKPPDPPVVTPPTGVSCIPADRLYSGWKNAGIPGGIPVRTNIFQTIASTNNTTDRTAAIKAAIEACNAAGGGVVQLGAGDFTCGLVYIYDNVTLRGMGAEGAKRTRIISNYAGGSYGCVLMGNSNAGYPWATTGTPLTASVARETSAIPCNASGFVVGDKVVLYLDADPTLPVVSIQASIGSGLIRCRAFRSKVVAKDAASVTLQDPMPFALPLGLRPTIAKADAGAFAYRAGMEDLELDCSRTANAYGVTMWSADQCWARNVRVTSAKNYDFMLLNSIHCEIHGDYINSIQNAGNNGAGILMERSSLNKIENSILRYAFPHIEMNFGCSGNVIGYNFCQNNSVIAGYGDTQGGSIDTNHGAHNSYNLFEGNTSPQLTADGYYGSSSDDMIFRNRLHGTNEEGATVGQKTSGSHCLELNRFTRRYTVVENVLGAPQSYWDAYGKTVRYENTVSGDTAPMIFQCGYPNLGNEGYTGTAQPSLGDNWVDWGTYNNVSLFQERDLDVNATMLRKGNYNAVNGGVPPSEALAGAVEPPSLYLTAKPAWFGALPWPAYGTGGDTGFDVAASFQRIPAGYRYFNNGANP